MAKHLRESFVQADALNRFWRTLYSGLGIDIVVGIALVLSTLLLTSNGWGDIEWAVLSFSIAKSIVQSVVSYVLRKWGDRSSLPTPKPPVPTGADIVPGVPDADGGELIEDGYATWTWLAIIAVAAVVLVVLFGVGR